MTKKTAKNSRVLAELLETAADLGAYGLLSKQDLLRLKILCAETPVYDPERIVAIRTDIAKVSQSVFASFLNVGVSTVQKWESPKSEKRPSGAAAKLLQLVEARGISALIP